jgi:hypothetical protein
MQIVLDEFDQHPPKRLLTPSPDSAELQSHNHSGR